MNDIAEKLNDLKALSCLSVLSDDDLVLVGRVAATRTFAKHELIFSEKENVQFFFTVRTGSVRLFKTSRKGKELVIRIMNPGDYFCCASIYGGGGHYVSAMALTDTALTLIPADTFREMLEGVSGISLKIITGLCLRIRDLSSLLADVTFHDVEQRVIRTLLKLGEETRQADGRAGLVLTHQEIASLTGTVREVVSRTMSRLKKKGVVLDSSANGFMLDTNKLSRLIRKDLSL